MALAVLLSFNIPQDKQSGSTLPSTADLFTRLESIPRVVTESEAAKASTPRNNWGNLAICRNGT
jgi:hypothetical protein